VPRELALIREARAGGSPRQREVAAALQELLAIALCWTTDRKHRKNRVNVLSPGPIEMPGFDNPGGTPEQISEFKADATAAVPMGRIGTPDEVATAAVFLASDDRSYVTGIEVFVDGGMAQVQPTVENERAGDIFLGSETTMPSGRTRHVDAEEALDRPLAHVWGKSP
jgi:hypothetical protein